MRYPIEWDTLSKKRAEIRTVMRKRRQQLSIAFREQAAKQICAKLTNHPILQDSQIIAGYLASDQEVDMQLWFDHAWQQDKQCYVPIIDYKRLCFARYAPNTPLTRNGWGILEPAHKNWLASQALEAVILPLVAFDVHGNRLGRGAGYYDRSFGFLLNPSPPNQPYLIGVGYECQHTDPLPSTPWDVPLREVITESSHYRIFELKDAQD